MIIFYLYSKPNKGQEHEKCTYNHESTCTEAAKMINPTFINKNPSFNICSKYVFVVTVLNENKSPVTYATPLDLQIENEQILDFPCQFKF